jgi:hypothetical protein
LVDPHLLVLKQVEQIPGNFPFKITDEKGMNAITLTRTYQGEQIEVQVHMPSLVSGEEPDHDNDGESDRETQIRRMKARNPLSQAFLSWSPSPRVMALLLNSLALPMLMRSSSTSWP